MSLQLFIQDVSSKDLTRASLQSVWENSNLKNKSQLIDPLTQALNAQLEKKATSEGKKIDEVSFKPEEAKKMCENFRNLIIRKRIPPTTPLLEDIPSSIAGANPDWKLNPASGIVFRPHTVGEKTTMVALRVLVGGRLYPLQLKHLSVCISNGWFFETDIPGISSPFKI